MSVSCPRSCRLRVRVRVRDVSVTCPEIFSGRSRSPIIKVSSESECESGCTDTECSAPLCNINFKVGHRKCYKHIKEQRGLPCNDTFPCHSCRARLKRDKTGFFSKYITTLRKDRVRTASKRASTDHVQNKSKHNQTR